MVRKTAGPGPAKYLLPSTVGYEHHAVNKYRNPQYTMRARYGFNPKVFGPGAKYNVENMTRYGKASPPAYSIYSRTMPPASRFSTPGPAKYNLESVPRMKEQRPPKYSMYSRTPGYKLPEYPGPKYNIPSTLGPKVPDMHASSAFTMSGKHDTKRAEQSPGPAKYGNSNANVYKPKPPQYSMAGRLDHVFTDHSPGPAAYGAYIPKNCMGGFSFGHRTDIDPYVTADDEAPCIEH